MIIQTPTKEKPVVVGGGVTVPVPGTLYHTTCEVLEVDEHQGRVRAKGIGFEAWFAKEVIRDAMSPGDFAIQNAINEQDRKDDLV